MIFRGWRSGGLCCLLAGKFTGLDCVCRLILEVWVLVILAVIVVGGKNKVRSERTKVCIF